MKKWMRKKEFMKEYGFSKTQVDRFCRSKYARDFVIRVTPGKVNSPMLIYATQAASVIEGGFLEDK